MRDQQLETRFATIAGGLLAVTLALMLTGCRDSPPSAPAQATRMLSEPLSDAGPASRPEEKPAAYPTWTLPAGARSAAVEPVGTLPPIGAPGVAAGPGARSGGGSVVGAIPVPTPRPTVDLAGAAPALTDPEIVVLMRQVERRRLRDDARRLKQLAQRRSQDENGLGDEEAADAAAAWLLDRFTEVGTQQESQVIAELEDFDARVDGKRKTLSNVIATLPGIGLEKRIVYVTSRVGWPGAKDGSAGADSEAAITADAAGTAALLESARVMASRRWDSTLRFLAFAAAGDELGSSNHAPLARRMKLPITAVLSIDGVGLRAGDADGQHPDEGGAALELRVAEEGDGPSGRLARTVQVLAERYMEDAVGVDGAGAAGADAGGQSSGAVTDDASFSDQGFAAVLLSGRLGSSAATDASDGELDIDALTDAARLIVAVVADLALAPPSPQKAPKLETDPQDPGALRVSWVRVDDPRVAGYWVAVRTGDSQRYERLEWAGDSTSHVLTSIEPGASVSVAVAASDDLGHISLFGPEAVR